jgi:hypothetical protein
MPMCRRGPGSGDNTISFADRRGASKTLSFEVDPDLADRLNQPATESDLQTSAKLRAFLNEQKESK